MHLHAVTIVNVRNLQRDGQNPALALTKVQLNQLLQHLSHRLWSIISRCLVAPVSLISPSGDGTLGGRASGLSARGPYRLHCVLEGEMSPGRAY